MGQALAVLTRPGGLQPVEEQGGVIIYFLSTLIKLACGHLFTWSTYVKIPTSTLLYLIVTVLVNFMISSVISNCM